VPRRIRENFGVAGAVHQRWQPPDLQFRAAFEQHVGLVENPDVAWFGIHEMLVFRASGDTGDLDFVTANFLSDGAEVRQGGDDVELGLGNRAEHCQQSKRTPFLYSGIHRLLDR
jgi:hypothetical protein